MASLGTTLPVPVQVLTYLTTPSVPFNVLSTQKLTEHRLKILRQDV